MPWSGLLVCGAAPKPVAAVAAPPAFFWVDLANADADARVVLISGLRADGR